MSTLTQMTFSYEITYSKDLLKLIFIELFPKIVRKIFLNIKIVPRCSFLDNWLNRTRIKNY